MNFCTSWYYHIGMYGQSCPKHPKYKFPKSFQYLKKEVRNKVDFLCRQVDTILLDPGMPKVHKMKTEVSDGVEFLYVSFFYEFWLGIPKVARLVYNILAIYLKKEVKCNLIFCMQLSINVFHWLILLFLTARHTKSTPNDKFAIS